MEDVDKPLVWLHGEVKTPPLTKEARIEAGMLLRRLQRGERLAMPHSRGMPSVGRRCHELRIQGADSSWRVIYRADPDAIVVLEVFSKKSQRTPEGVLQACKARLQRYDSDCGG